MPKDWKTRLIHSDATVPQGFRSLATPVMRTAVSALIVSYSALVGFALAVVTDQQRKAAHEIAELALSALVEPGRVVQPRSFDISPDGRVVAVLYSSWGVAPMRSPSGLWVTLWEVASRKTIRSVSVIAPGSLVSDPRDFKRVIFTADQSCILVLAQKTVWVVDPKSGTMRPVDPPRPTAGAPMRMQALNGALVAISYQEEDEDGFYTQFFDTSSFKTATGWHSLAAPSSFSPDGKLALASAKGHWNKGGVLKLQLIDTASGEILKTMETNFGFPFRWWWGKRGAVGGVAARFLDNTRILVCPDHMIDQTGNHSGHELEIIDVVQNRVVSTMKPPSFGPTGDLVVSHDRSHFAVYSLSASAWAFHSESLNPKDYKRNIFIFARDDAVHEAVIEDPPSGGFGTYSGDMMRLSGDGSILAVADGSSEAVRVFEVK